VTIPCMREQARVSRVCSLIHGVLTSLREIPIWILSWWRSRVQHCTTRRASKWYQCPAYSESLIRHMRLCVVSQYLDKTARHFHNCIPFKFVHSCEHKLSPKKTVPISLYALGYLHAPQINRPSNSPAIAVAPLVHN
jgi:hypothetical protein